MSSSIKALDSTSVHRITSGQVVVDLQTAVKELVENSLDAGATSIEVRFKEYGLKAIEVIDNGSGIAPEDYESIALKHHTSKLSSFSDLATIQSFGFRGEALSSLCALSQGVSVTTATSDEAPVGTILEMERNGKLKAGSKKVARQRGTTVAVTGIFSPLPVRRKELSRNIKREFSKALALLTAYALVPCSQDGRGVRFTVVNYNEKGQRMVQIQSDGAKSIKSSVSAVWGPKTLANLEVLDLEFDVTPEKSLMKRVPESEEVTHVHVEGLISRFTFGCGRTGTDRQFFYINGRPCNLPKVQKIFNEVYRSFNTNQAPFIIANIIIPTNTCDVNVSPDKRTVFLHSEYNLIAALKISLEEAFSPERSTFAVNTQTQIAQSSDPSSTFPTAESSLPNSDTTLSSEPAAGTSSPVGSSSPPPQNQAQSDTNDDEQGILSSIRSNSIERDLIRQARYQNKARRTLPPPAAQASKAKQTRLDDGFLQKQAGVNKPSRSTPAPASDAEESETEENGTRNSTEGVDEEMHVDDVSFGSTNNLLRHSLELPLHAPSSPPIDHIATGPDHARSQSPPALFLPSPSPAHRSPVTNKEQAEEVVLSTSRASWNRSRSPESIGDDGTDGPERKKAKLSLTPVKVQGKLGLRSQIASFAMEGSQVQHVEDEDAGEGGERRDEGLHDDGLEGTIGAGGAENMDIDYSSPRLAGAGLSRPSRASSPKQDQSDRDRTPALEDDHHGEKAEEDDLLDDDEQDAQTEPAESQSNAATSSAPSHPEIIRTASDDSSVKYQFSLDRVSKLWEQLSQVDLDESTRSPAKHPIIDAGFETDSDEAERVLARTIHKEDFGSMRVLGQFNLGFIIARKISPRSSPSPATQTSLSAMDDLFIVDQHASDEKYNFETLQLTTKIESQLLFQPRPLDFTASDQILAMENIDILRKNGFDISIEADPSSGQRERAMLLAQPVSKSTTFDMHDLGELLHLMKGTPTGSMVRCSKARAMFASRACRKSVMIGKALTLRQMENILRHMGTIEQPWNCPHGRPTMRHLVNLNGYVGPRQKNIDWSTLLSE
ncbi:DNA mismatch repair protein MutL [Sistotremastrum niveocremeum HHB9708]|uniref:DNA mismatch repair protein PMS1 n=1 Tax=Sistotremastrum niveocremeum HHB9708 TaxID=1314777 RepID=A0A164WSU7_9AGAM|nr:DNA mismatch repair protein MutL [Sistotremastrum niveocremeum HHB9708]